jgi:hypothetical protein
MLYHYTTSLNYKLIMNDAPIRPSTAFVPAIRGLSSGFRLILSGNLLFRCCSFAKWIAPPGVTSCAQSFRWEFSQCAS